MVYKEKWEAVSKLLETAETVNENLRRELKAREEELVARRSMERFAIEKDERTKKLEKDLSALREDNRRLGLRVKAQEADRKDLEAFKELKSILVKIIPFPAVPLTVGEPAPSEISVSTGQPELKVKVEHRPLELTEEKLEGKIAILYAEGFFGEEWFTVTDVTRGFIKHGWPQNPQTSKAKKGESSVEDILEKRKAAAAKQLEMMMIERMLEEEKKKLEDAKKSSGEAVEGQRAKRDFVTELLAMAQIDPEKALDQFCQWGFFEKRFRGNRPEYKLRMKPEDAKEKGLINTLLDKT